MNAENPSTQAKRQETGQFLAFLLALMDSPGPPKGA
jgi:hypothetical protein